MSTMLNNRTIKIIYLLILVITPIFFKMWHVENILISHTGTRLFGAIQVFINDARIYSTIMLLFYLSYLSKIPHIASILLRGIALLLFFLYVVDFYVIINFNAHISVTDLIKYSSYSLKYIQQIYNGKGTVLLIMMIVAVGFVTQLIFSKYKIKNNTIHRYSIVTILIVFFTSSFATAGSDKYVHAWIYRNFIDYNLMIWSEGKEYSGEFINELNFSEKKSCYSKKPEKPNIILLMVESLSSYQSNHFSGIKNWTPNLDMIARKNASYKNFYANGFTTEDGEISLLTGQLPLRRPSSYTNGGGTSFHGFFGVKESLPNILKEQGYKTEFLTTADLSFANTGDWAKSIGFDYIEGHECQYYEGWDRLNFKAAPDEALFNRVLDRIKHNNGKYFMFIKTVSTHHPFINPETKDRSEEEVFKYSDRQIGMFYKNLINMNFFDEGLLIIVGDHHSMVPLKNEEIELFGSIKASAKVPMIVSYGDKKSSVVNEQYQQTDIFNFVKGLISNTQCYSDWIGDILSGRPAKYIAHRRGDNRNVTSVFSVEKDYSVILDGDNTRLKADEDKNIGAQDLIIKKINAVRILQNGGQPCLIKQIYSDSKKRRS